MPVLKRELTGDDGCAAPVSIFQEFEYVASVPIIGGGKPPIIENQSGIFGQGGHEFRISSIALGNREFLEEARQPQIQNGIPLATGLVAQGTCEPGVADAGGAGDEHIVALVDPLARDQAAAGELYRAHAGDDRRSPQRWHSAATWPGAHAW